MLPRRCGAATAVLHDGSPLPVLGSPGCRSGVRSPGLAFVVLRVTFQATWGRNAGASPIMSGSPAPRVRHLVRRSTPATPSRLRWQHPPGCAVRSRFAGHHRDCWRACSACRYAGATSRWWDCRNSNHERVADPQACRWGRQPLGEGAAQRPARDWVRQAGCIGGSGHRRESAGAASPVAAGASASVRCCSKRCPCGSLASTAGAPILRQRRGVGRRPAPWTHRGVWEHDLDRVDLDRVDRTACARRRQ